MKKYVFFILLFSLVILSSCYHQVDQGKTPEPTQTQNMNNNVQPSEQNMNNEAQPSEQDMNDDANQSENALTYSQYRDLCNDIAENLVLKHFNLIHNEPNYIIVDKDITFYQRQFLTVSGDQDSDTTQVRLAYATEDLEHIIFIDLSYMKKALYNDLLYSGNKIPSNLKHIKLLGRYDNCILSYKNILISITHIINTPTGEVDSSITNQSVVIDTARAMVDYLLNKYEAE
ncbi:MAG: hypothetical protein FWJ59_00630 [Caldicoprobacter sp.]|uniref:hypothetical protein n=1 Tax=Caldicoprobacter sp. TaxID=2004500 RepID=UPI0039C457FF